MRVGVIVVIVVGRNCATGQVLLSLPLDPAEEEEQYDKDQRQTSDATNDATDNSRCGNTAL